MPLCEIHRIDRAILILAIVFFVTAAAGCYLAVPIESQPDVYASNLTCEYPSPSVTVCYDRKPKQHIYSEEKAR